MLDIGYDVVIVHGDTLNKGSSHYMGRGKFTTTTKGLLLLNNQPLDVNIKSIRSVKA
jgi:hypothetical protein